MKTLTTLITVIFISLLSSPSFSNEMEGKFVCHFIYSDGSGDPEMYTIDGNTLKIQFLDSKNVMEYKEINTTYDRYKTFVSVDTNNTYQVLIMIGLAEDKDTIMVTLFDTEPYYKTNKTWGGNCKRSYL